MAGPGRILIVINKKSGAENDDSEERLRDLMKKHDVISELLHVPEEDAAGVIFRKIREFNPHIVAAAGGDGTVNLVASVVTGMPVRMGIIPQGSANGLAYELGIPDKIEQAVEFILKGRSKPMDIVRINDRHISLHLSDAGINARIVREFEKEGKRGLKGYFRQFMKEFLKPKEGFRCTLMIGNKVYSHRSYMTVIANASSYRTGANLNPSGKTDDGRFEIVVFKPYPRWVLRSMIGAFTGTLHQRPNIKTYSCSRAVIKLTPPQELQVDGESLGKTDEIRAVIEKHALNLIC